MDSAKSLQTIGFVFLASGVAFTTVAFATKLAPLYVMGPVFLVLGIVFTATSKVRRK